MFRRKPKFIYELSECTLLKEEEIFNPDDLFLFIQEEDYRFRRDYLKGSVVVTKVRNNLEGTVYYAKRLHLPQEEGFDWVAELADFYTKKPLDYFLEEPIVESVNDSEPVLSVDSDEALTLDDFEADIQPVTKTDKPEQTESKIESVLSSSSEMEQEQVLAEENSEEFVQISKSELQSIKEALDRHQKEIKQFREEKATEIQSTTASAETPSEDNMLKEMTKLLDTEPVKGKSLDIEVATDEIVQEVLQSTKVEFGQALTKFIEKETKKINQEIQQLDKRHLIEESVTKRLQAKKQEELANLENQLINQKQQQVQEEKLRHQQALQNIEKSFTTQLEGETETIQNSYKETVDQTIKKEYEQQTEQLSRVLQGKMDELKLRQHTVNTGLEANFKEILETFNREHTQVIHEVEQKKQQSPISLEERRLRLQG